MISRRPPEAGLRRWRTLRTLPATVRPAPLWAWRPPSPRKTDIPDVSGLATSSALTSGLAGKVDKTASQPGTLGLTATELDSMYKDANGIVRVGRAKE